MDTLRRFRGAGLAMGLLIVVIAVSQTVDFGRLALSPNGFSLSPRGDDVPQLAPVTVTFPAAPDAADPASLLQLYPKTAGSYAWLSPRRLLFQPDFPGLVRGSTYTVVVPARPDAGVPDPVTTKFTVTGKLTVQQVIPGNGDTEVPLNAQVLVQFSRSVAPLSTLAARPADQVVRFDPPLHGKGEWLNTSIYRFVPSDLAPTTTYTMTVAKGLTSAADGILESDFHARFTTITPAVDSIVPDASWQYGGPWQQVVVTFNQPMDASAADGVSVTSDGGTTLPERREWNAEHTVLTLIPTARLANDTHYVITVAQGLRGARGGSTSSVRTSAFTTVGVPSVRSTSPRDGDVNAPRYGANIQFGSPMDPDSLDGKLSVSGFTADQLQGNVFVSPMNIGISLPFKPSTRYTVTLAPGATDRYGQVMGGYTFSFTTGALEPSVSLAVASYQAATFSSSSEPFVWFQTTNTNEVTFTLYPLTASEAKLLMFSGAGPRFEPSQPAIRAWHETIPEAKDQTLLNKTSVSGGGPLPKGSYLLVTDGQPGSRLAFAVVDTEIITKLSFDQLVAWVVDHDSGKPVEGVSVHAEGTLNGPTEAVTDANGLASFSVPTPTASNSVDRSAWLTIGGDRFGVVSTRWQGTSAYQYQLPAEFWAREWVGQVYTDRPLYRPGETVQYKGIVRADDDAAYAIPPATAQFEFVLRNSRGQELQREPVTLSEFGSFDGSYTLPSDAPTGDYVFTVQPAGSRSGYGFASNSFLVAEFRTPEFQVEMGTDRGSYTNGDTIAARAGATFFFGGPLGGASVEWSAIASPFTMRVKGFESYSFSDFDYSRQAVTKEPVRAKGTATTGADGIATFSVPAALNAAEGAQQFTVSATVTDQNGQAVAGSTQVTVHPAALYAGIRARRYVATVGSDATLELVTVDTDGKVLPGRHVTVRVYDRQWITTKVLVPGGGRRYQSEPRDTLLATLDATTGTDGTGSVTYRPTAPGQLRVVAEVTDAQGRTSRSATWVWVSGARFALWQVTNDDAIKLVADRQRYEVGDTAEVLVPAPFAGATALVTVERGKIITREVRTFRTNSERLAIPITDRSVPDVFVSVVLYRGPTAVDPIPRYKVGYVELPVSTATRRLDVAVTPDRAQAKPGDTVRYDIAVTDASGKGVRSELSVAVVDKALLSLQDERGPDGLHAFWFERGLGVTTTSSLTTSLDRWNDAVAELPRGGKGGSGSGLQGDRVRETFRSTAYWQAQLVTDAQGRASVSVTLPDNLTTWHLQARAISGDTMVGEGTNELVSSKPILLRPALPRFLRVGDTADLRVLVRNGRSTPADVSVTLAAQGVRVGGDLTQTKTVPAGASLAYTWSATDPAEGTVQLSFAATASGGDGDAVTLRLPSQIDMTPETTSTNGVVTGLSALEAVYLPPYADQAHGSLSVSVRSALVGSLSDELTYFAPHQYEGAEYVASRFLATIAVARAERSATGAGRHDADLARDLGGLIGRQRPDGGWAWCDDPQCASDPNVTGWVLLALGEARRDRMSVDAAVVQRATTYLLGIIDRTNTSLEPTANDIDQKAFLIAAAAAAGGGMESRANALLEQYRARLANWGRAYLVEAFLDDGAKPDDPRIRTLLGDLSAATIPSANGNHWEDGPAEAAKASFMTSTSTTGLVALALARTRPDYELLAQTVRWLVVARSAQRWTTSIDRALAMLALSSYTVKTGELGGSYAYTVLLDDQKVLAGLVRPAATPTVASATIPLARLVPGKTSLLALDRDSSVSGRMYYTLDLRYLTPAKQVEALNRGFALSHRYTALDHPDTPITTAKLGEVVRVTVTVLAPHDASYVSVEDLLPAGLEPVDARLKTTDPALRGKLEQERRQSAQGASGGYVAPWLRWYYSPWQHVDLRDDRVVLQADRLARGVYEYVYYARATTTGDFFVAPAHAEETYFPEVFGRSDSGRFTVRE